MPDLAKQGKEENDCSVMKKSFNKLKLLITPIRVTGKIHSNVGSIHYFTNL